uniref:Flavin-containing monooxygenase n=1 Tax=Romanomermis culicivorax TaxID=13658 RepID=A0A915JRJ5_ROMCU
MPRLYIVSLEYLTSLTFDRRTVTQCANKKLISNKTQVVSDELPFYISSGQVVVKPNDGTTLDIDDVIFCTGYTQGQRLLKQNEAKSVLFKLMYPIWNEDGTSKQHNTLCFVGMAAPRGALAPISEMQARLHCA